MLALLSEADILEFHTPLVDLWSKNQKQFVTIITIKSTVLLADKRTT